MKLLKEDCLSGFGLFEKWLFIRTRNKKVMVKIEDDSIVS